MCYRKNVWLVVRVYGTFGGHQAQKASSEPSTPDATLPFAHTACCLMAQVPGALKAGVCESAPGRFAPSEAAVTGRGRVVLALTSHRDERSTTAQHQTASSSDLQGRSRWPDGIVMSLLMTTAAHAGSGTPGSRGLGPVGGQSPSRVTSSRLVHQPHSPGL